MPTYGALTLDSASSYGTTAHHADFDLTGQTATIEAWIKGRTVVNTQWLFSKATAQTVGWGAPFDATGRLAFRATVGGVTQLGPYGGASAMDGTWHHVAAVKTAANMLSYLDGVLVGTNTAGAGGALTSNAAGIQVNGFSPATAVNGFTISELRLWSTARTVAEILAMRDVQAVGTESGLVACWPFDDNTGASARELVHNHPLALTKPQWVVPAVPTWALAIGASGQPRGIPNLLWEGDTTGPETVDHPAHFYVITVTAYAPGEGAFTVPFGTRLYDIGDVIVMGPGSAVRETHRLRYAAQEVWPSIVPAEGLYLDVHPSIECHVQAWTLL